MNDENLPDVQDAYERLRDQATGLDTMAARRSIEHRTRARRRMAGAFAAVSVAIVAVIGLVVLRSEDADQDVATPVSSTTTISPPADPLAVALEGTEWTLLAGDSPPPELSLPKEPPISLTFDDAEVAATLWCRNARGTYQRDGAALEVDGLVDSVGRGTVPCEPEVWASEEAFLAALAGVERVTLDGTSLILSGPSIQLSFTADPPIVTDELVDQLWLLDAVITRETPSAPVGEPATLFFEAGGRAMGSTGCRPLYGDYLVSGAELRLTSGGGGVCTPRSALQDEIIRAVLAHATVRIESDRLRLTSGERSLSYLAIDRSPITSNDTVSVAEFEELRPIGDDAVTVSGHLVNRGGPWVLCESARFEESVGHFCDSPSVVVTNYDRAIDPRTDPPTSPEDAALALAEVDPDFVVDDGIVWTPEPVDLVVIGVDFDELGNVRAAVPAWPTDADLTQEDLDLLTAFDAIDDSDPIDVGALRLAESGVRLGPSNQLVATRTPDELTDPDAWAFERDTFPAYEGPFSALELLAGPLETTIRAGSHAHCASPPMPVHPDLQGLRHLSIQPAGIDSCLQWFTVDLYLDDAGDVVAITLDLWEP